ncbi:unnamed protein product [Tuber melanosporum]|uniref:(Perigord truffle) hypothetical protein n=1 Tax=Tuber melanosporum (strain Mel28) TaxID=656061 RepID=D5GCU7_TUBMM|nr:uncharacterized protein GSTUM_00000754001 [Tuber melanosporum]CAZ82340.1 unnamed protein product [Tuber melanosporum]
MRINSLLNEGPSSDPHTVNLGNTSTYKAPQSIHTPTDPGFLLHHVSHNTSGAEPAASQLPSHYSPLQQPTNLSRGTISSRSSYSGPSLHSSTAATSPLEASMPPLSAAANDRSGHSARIHETTETASRTGSSFPGRTLPPLTTMVPSGPPGSIACDGPLSPHSTGHYPHQNGTEMSYFSSSRGFYQGQSPQQSQQYPQPLFPQQSHEHVRSNALMNFAVVAMETATPVGRKNLEMEAAAEAGRRQSGGSFAEDSIRRNSAPTTIASREQANRAPIPGAGREGGVASDNKPLFLDLDPALRPPSAGSLASTGRTIEEDDQAVHNSFQANTGACFTGHNASMSHESAPLFRPTPEPHTPTLADANSPDIGLSAAPGTGPLNIPSPSPQSFLNEAPKCSYCNVCTTGSPLRKVVSHIFGRNKLSTRQIPKNVWVYYCRKHYQRSRYRNPRGFARQQVLLVKRQCERLQLWGGVKDWVIKVRRREELRMNREVGENGEDADEAEDDEEGIADEDPEPNDGGPTSGENSRRNSTTVPRRRSSAGGGSNWIIRYTGMEKTIDDIYLLLGKIELEVQENGGKFPDVELLPNVDLSMAAPLVEAEGGGDEGGNGNPGDNDKQEDAEDGGVSGRKAGKKRRRSDGGSGSSGGDDGGGAKGSKKAKNIPPKKGDRKGKKGSSHAEIIPDQVSTDTGGRLEKAEVSGPFGVPLSSGDVGVSNGHWRTQSDFCRSSITLAEYHGPTHPEQVVTPPPSISSTGRSTPEFDDCQPAHTGKGRRARGSVTQDTCEAVYNLSPRRSARVLPVAVTTPKQPNFTHRNSGIGSPSPSNFTPRELAAIAGEPLHRFDFRRPEVFCFGEMFSESSNRKGPEKSKVSLGFDSGPRRPRVGKGADEVFECIRVATNV